MNLKSRVNKLEQVPAKPVIDQFQDWTAGDMQITLDCLYNKKPLPPRLESKFAKIDLKMAERWLMAQKKS